MYIDRCSFYGFVQEGVAEEINHFGEIEDRLVEIDKQVK